MAKWQITITNKKTGSVTTSFTSADIPKVDSAIKRAEESTPIKDLPDEWEISVYRLKYTD